MTWEPYLDIGPCMEAADPPDSRSPPDLRIRASALSWKVVGTMELTPPVLYPVGELSHSQPHSPNLPLRFLGCGYERDSVRIHHNLIIEGLTAFPRLRPDFPWWVLLILFVVGGEDKRQGAQGSRCPATTYSRS